MAVILVIWLDSTVSKFDDLESHKSAHSRDSGDIFFHGTVQFPYSGFLQKTIHDRDFGDIFWFMARKIPTDSYQNSSSQNHASSMIWSPTSLLTIEILVISSFTAQCKFDLLGSYQSLVVHQS